MLCCHDSDEIHASMASQLKLVEWGSSDLGCLTLGSSTAAYTHRHAVPLQGAMTQLIFRHAVSLKGYRAHRHKQNAKRCTHTLGMASGKTEQMRAARCRTDPKAWHISGDHNSWFCIKGR